MTIETAAEKLCPAVRSITFNEKFLGFAVCLNLLQYSQTSEHWLDFRTKSRTVGSSWSWVPNHSERANWHKCLIIWVDILKTGELPDVQKKKNPQKKYFGELWRVCLDNPAQTLQTSAYVLLHSKGTVRASVLLSTLSCSYWKTLMWPGNINSMKQYKGRLL